MLVLNLMGVKRQRVKLWIWLLIKLDWNLSETWFLWYSFCHNSNDIILLSSSSRGGGCKIYIGCLNWPVSVILIVLLHLSSTDYYDSVIDSMLVYLPFLANFEDTDTE